MSNKYKGPESQDCELYNSALAAHTGELVYDLEERLHKLWVNDELLEQQNGIKMLSKMILSLHSIPQFFVVDGEKKIWLTIQEIGRATETAQVFA